MAAKNVTLKDLINDIDPEIKNLLYSDFRTELQTNITVLDISYKSLSVNSNDPYFKEIYNTLINVVEKTTTVQYSSINNIPNGYFDKAAPGVVYVSGPGENKYLIGKTERVIRTFVTDKISKDASLVNSIFGQRKVEKEVINRAGKPTGDITTTLISNVDIGHTATEGISPLISPLSQKIGSILEYGELSGNNRAKQYAEEALSELYAIQADIEYSFKSYAPEVLSGYTGALGEAYVVVTLHTSNLNQQFSDKEKAIFAKLQGKLALLATKKLRDRFLDISGSNTILEDITQGIVSALKGNKTPLTPHKKQTVKSSTLKIPKNIKASTTGKIAPEIKKPKDTPVINTYSLIDLQTLINTHLQNVISANMGEGTARNILNYRTGRFAASAKVIRISESRQGMITAFYEYMKNPYQTFEPGYQQGSPKTRDPKLLIATSIREIAATKVGNRLRAVSI